MKERGGTNLEGEWWQITEFAVEISKTLQEKYQDDKFSVHYNTVDKWFKNLETKRIHYISRAAGEKVYDKMDLVIGCFIADARKDNKFRLDVIYEQIPRQLEVRPFPTDFGDQSVQSIDEAALVRKMEEKMAKVLAQQLSVYEEKVQLQMQKLLEAGVNDAVKKMLPGPNDQAQERAQRLNDMITRSRVERKCEDKAIEEWNKQPEVERMKKIGLFRKEEDYIKRDNFIRSYKKEHLHKMLEEAYNIEKTTVSTQ
jgi:hypothetical protein